jgi:hypothetical protein
MNDTTDMNEIDNAVSAAADARMEDIRRDAAIQFLGSRRTLTLGELVKLCSSQSFGTLYASISLNDLLGEQTETSAAPKPAKAPKAKPAKAPKAAAAASKGRQKFDREEVYDKILGVLQAVAAPMSRSEIAEATGYNDDQTRSFLKELKKAKRVKAEGAAASTRYHL